MKGLKRYILISAAAVLSSSVFAQYNNSGISAGFFDSSENATINFSNFHLPPLGVLLENAKQNPRVLSLEKAHELAVAEVAKQKRHIFSYVTGHASYSYGKTDMWGQNSSTYSMVLQQYQGSEQSYWNVGVSLAVPLEDILDLAGSVKRKRIQADMAMYQKDIEFENLKKEITSLFIKITNNLVTLKTAGESAAINIGAGALNQEDFHQGNMTIEGFAYTKERELGVVKQYQAMQTEITTDIITLELLSHTPILTNTTTEITLDNGDKKTEKQIRKENKAVEKQIRKAAAAEEKKYAKMEEAERKAQKKAEKEAAKAQKKAAKAQKK